MDMGFTFQITIIMAGIKEIMLSVQGRLGERVPELGYVDKDWGQLSHEKPAVKFPCALLDIENINYTQQGGGYQQADTQITVTVANLRLTAASLNAPRKEDAYKVIDLLERIHEALQLFSDGDYAPLFRTNLKKVLADSSKECYKITYQTAFAVSLDTGGGTAPAPEVKIHFK